MILIKNENSEPYQNMATEEYLLMTATEPLVMFWRNEPAVIVGKNQDARAEVDFAFTSKKGIKVVRRLTGGGAVFHDTGNINYTFIVPGGAALDFAAFADPIIKVLADLGISAERSGRNDLIVSNDGRKFSGTAQCVYRRKNAPAGEEQVLMHHGTLLFSADMSALAGALTPDKEKIESKGIRSVKSRVVNLATLLPEEMRSMTAEAFKLHLERHFEKEGASVRTLSEEDLSAIRLLSREKYATQAWLFGKFGTAKKTRRRFDFGTVAVSLDASDGKVKDISFSGDFFGAKDISALEHHLSGITLSSGAIEQALESANLSDYILGASCQEIAELILEAK